MSTKKTFISHSSSSTKKIAQVLINGILKKSLSKKPLVLALVGELGSGKTTFLQGLAKGLKIKEEVLSPTFIIMRKFQLSSPAIKHFNNFYHIDCYRLQKSKEILDLGFKEIILEPKNIIAIEWADRIKKNIPQKAIWIFFEFIDKNERKIVIRFPKSF